MARSRTSDTELKRLAARLEARHETDTALLRHGQPAPVAASALAHLVRTIPVQWAAVFAFDYAADVAHVLAAVGDSPPLTTHRQVPLTEFGLAPGAMVWDRSLDDDLLAVATAGEGDTGMPTLRLPLVAGNVLVGALDLATPPGTALAEMDLLLVRELVNELAIALQHAQLLERERVARLQAEALAQRLVEVQESERRELARTLHDSLGQELTALSLILDAADREGSVAAAAGLVRARQLVRELTTAVRSLAMELRPAVLDDLGLLPAVQWLTDRYTSQTGIGVRLIQVGLRDDGTDLRFDPRVETAAYRLIQESLTNVARHAGVDQVEVQLWCDARALRLEVADEGPGFDVNAALAANRSSGLTGMMERAALLGGRLTIASAPGEGTRIVARLPRVLS